MIVHCGAGSGKFGKKDGRYSELKAALEAGMTAMGSGSSVDGVEVAVRSMEDSGAFNAGRGASLTADGKVQLDAAIMEGGRLRGAGVGAETATYHAVSLARWVMENTSHVLLVGDYAGDAAGAAGLPVEELKPSKAASQKFALLRSDPTARQRENLAAMARMREGNTVGAVAVDRDGIPAAAVSTGGTWMKLPGRVGDSAIMGAGIYANKAGAACATGAGEEIMKSVLCWQACSLMKRLSASAAARKAISIITRASGPGTAGIIAVDRRGNVGSNCNTEGMGRAWYDMNGRARVAT